MTDSDTDSDRHKAIRQQEIGKKHKNEDTEGENKAKNKETHTYTNTCKGHAHLRTYIPIYEYIHKYMNTCIHVHAYINICAQTNAHTLNPAVSKVRKSFHTYRLQNDMTLRHEYFFITHTKYVNQSVANIP